MSRKMKPYSLYRCKKILVDVYQLWRKKKKRLLPAQASEIQNDLRVLQDAVLKKNQDQANNFAHKCQDYGRGILKKSPFEQIRDFVFALAMALAVALLIRQMWFELYEIPTGSMRPTFKEKDRLIVSKTDFGINIPFTTKHFYFNPDLVKRSGIIVFSVEGMDVHDPNTMYFWIFPGKKQFVKRMMGKPGDTVYFYGGKIYGIDKDGNDISDQLQLPQLSSIDHVPFIRFEGSPTLAEPFQSSMGPAYRMAILYQMNEPVARLTVLGNNRLEGEMLRTPSIHNRSTPPVKNYYELWGMENYAAARIVTREEIRGFAEKNGISLNNEKYFLELKHHPNLKQLELSKDYYGRLIPQFALNTSIIPLDEKHLKFLFNNLYTGRFVVKNGYAMRYGRTGRSNIGSYFLIRLEGIPDGVYEYYYGQPYQINWAGIARKLAANHPLRKFSFDLVQSLFNNGIDFDKRFAIGPHFDTSRYAYFREGDLYVMGAAIFKKSEEVLQNFVEKEKSREANANIRDSCLPFVDSGPPIKEGKIDVEKIRQYGLLIPQKSYLALGDNFAMSADSRDFGFVPQGNLRGGPSFIFWPPGSRFGPPNQPSYPWFTLPNILVWIFAVIFFGAWYIVHRKHHLLPLKDL